MMVERTMQSTCFLVYLPITHAPFEKYCPIQNVGLILPRYVLNAHLGSEAITGDKGEG